MLRYLFLGLFQGVILYFTLLWLGRTHWIVLPVNLLLYITMFCPFHLINASFLRSRGYHISGKQFWLGVLSARRSRRKPLPMRDELAVTPLWNPEKSDYENALAANEIYLARYYDEL